MTLTYRGIAYTPLASSVEWTDRTVSRTYRGLPYQRRIAQRVPPQPQHNLTYRGIAYRTDAAGQAQPRVEGPRRLTTASLSAVARSHRDNVLRRLEARVDTAQRQGNTILLQQLEQERQQIV